MESKVVEAFDQHAEDYDRWFDTLEGRILFEMEIKAVRILMKGLGHPFLEIGVGTGRFARELGIDYGVDPSSRVLEIAKSRGITAEKAKGENLPYKDDSFGAVFLLFTLCFVEDPEKVLLEAKRVLKQNGGLIVGIINRESPWGQFYIKKKEKGHPIYKHARFYAVQEIIEIIEEVNFVVKGYSSTLCQSLSEMSRDEVVSNELIKGAGFVCILSRKSL
ncbi:MAG: class I SAM-dependent methyltransferase [Nitrospirae bacterium]|nr:class I SAM-dependent methyltransferase [Nitrospirota bacterium]